MFELDDNELLSYIKDDVPYFDMTTYLQNCTNTFVNLKIFTREDLLISCSEEAARIAKLLSCEVINYKTSKTKILKDEVIIEIKGDYNKVQQAHRLIQILLEYSCKIATTTEKMVKKIKAINPDCELLTTRKSYPFAKRFCIKSILNGGAMPHRLGLSETILFFNSHRKIYSDNNEFYKQIPHFKKMVPEKKIVVESSDFEDIKNLLEYGVDVLQVDKADIEFFKKIIEYKNQNGYKNVTVLAAGGININNVESFVKSGVDGIVTSSLYNCGMADLGSNFTKI